NVSNGEQRASLGGVAVAKLTATNNCRWNNGSPTLRPGDRLAIGQSLHLADGIAEIVFSVGTRIIVQSPALVSIESANSVSMKSGKLTAEITTPEARGFKVITPE